MISETLVPMVMVVSEFFLFSMYLVVFLAIFLFIIFLILIRRNAPEAFLLMKCRRKRLPLTIVHYPEGTMKMFIPKIERDNPEVSTPYITVKECGIKFRNPDGRKTERLSGDIPCVHYFVNVPEPVATFDVVALDQLKDYFKKQGHDLTSVEDVAFYVLSEYERTGDIEYALRSAKIDNEEVKKKLVDFLKYVDSRKGEIKKLKLRSGIFTYKTATSVIDTTIAFTSSNVAHLKSVLEAKIRHQLANPTGDLIKYGIFVMIICLGMGTFILLVRG